MAISNWQNIPFCIEALIKIDPKRVLDINVGFGRWGIIIREFCDVRQGYISPPDWQVHIEGVTDVAENVSDYHRQFYNKIHINDVNQAVSDLSKWRWDVTILDDVLKHFDKNKAHKLLIDLLAVSNYILINVPLGNVRGDQDDEQYRSRWDAADFEHFGLRRATFFEDSPGKLFGSFIVSELDPQKLEDSLYSKRPKLNQLNPGGTYSYLTLAQQQILIQAEQNAKELDKIKNTLTWQIYEKIDRSSLGNPLRQFTRVVGAPFRPRSAEPKKNIKNGVSIESKQIEPNDNTAPQGVDHIQPTTFSAEEKAWLAKFNNCQPEAIAILHPDWLGIRSSVSNLFDTRHLYFVDDTLDLKKAYHLVRLIMETECPRVVINGFPLTYMHLVHALHRVTPATKIYVLWQGNWLQGQENYARESFALIKQLCQEGLIYKWGFAKKGMAEIIAAQTGIRTGFVMNYIRQIPEKSSVPLNNGPHIGIFSSGSVWKSPYAMLASTTLIPNAKLHLTGLNLPVKEFIGTLAIKIETMAKRIPQEKMPEKLARMHLNMNITLTECTPLLPLESLAVGTPCLISATSHLFEDHSYLRERLIVPYHERPEIIADYAQKAIDERDKIITAYRDYALEYNLRARASLVKFLEI